MKLSGEQVRDIAWRCIDQREAERSLTFHLKRDLTEPEGNELYEVIHDAVTQALADYEFEEGEPTPVVSFMQTWADDHVGERYRRPKGHVIYTVTGEVVRHHHGLVTGLAGIEMRRSSDGKTTPMRISELETMVLLTEERNDHVSP